MSLSSFRADYIIDCLSERFLLHKDFCSMPYNALEASWLLGVPSTRALYWDDARGVYCIYPVVNEPQPSCATMLSMGPRPAFFSGGVLYERPPEANMKQLQPPVRCTTATMRQMSMLWSPVRWSVANNASTLIYSPSVPKIRPYLRRAGSISLQHTILQYPRMSILKGLNRIEIEEQRPDTVAESRRISEATTSLLLRHKVSEKTRTSRGLELTSESELSTSTTDALSESTTLSLFPDLISKSPIIPCVVSPAKRAARQVRVHRDHTQIRGITSKADLRNVIPLKAFVPPPRIRVASASKLSDSMVKANIRDKLWRPPPSENSPVSQSSFPSTTELGLSNEQQPTPDQPESRAQASTSTKEEVQPAFKTLTMKRLVPVKPLRRRDHQELKAWNLTAEHSKRKRKKKNKAKKGQAEHAKPAAKVSRKVKPKMRKKKRAKSRVSEESTVERPPNSRPLKTAPKELSVKVARSSA